MVLEVSLIMVWFGSGFIDVIVDDLIRWWCFASCWVSTLLLGLNLYRSEERRVGKECSS